VHAIAISIGGRTRTMSAWPAKPLPADAAPLASGTASVTA
jgi:hypothetical protein